MKPNLDCWIFQMMANYTNLNSKSDDQKNISNRNRENSRTANEKHVLSGVQTRASVTSVPTVDSWRKLKERHDNKRDGRKEGGKVQNGLICFRK